MALNGALQTEKAFQKLSYPLSSLTPNVFTCHDAGKPIFMPYFASEKKKGSIIFALSYTLSP